MSAAPASGNSISRFPVVNLEDLPPDVRERIQEVAAKTGFVPNVFLVLAWRPAEWRAFFAYHDALMEKESEALSQADRQLIVVATSAANDCLYCVVAHGAVARIRSRNPLISDQVAVDWRKADLSLRQHSMLEFAVTLATRPAEVTAEHLERLRDAGFSQDDIWDIGAITAFYAMSNRIAHLTAMPPNEEFYLMGRVPKEVLAQLK
jgi:uncharacterized peroxidase-related enzyme